MPRISHISSHSIFSTPQSYLEFTDVENKYGEVKLLPKDINVNGSQNSYLVCTTSEQKLFTSLLPLFLFSLILKTRWIMRINSQFSVEGYLSKVFLHL